MGDITGQINTKKLEQTGMGDEDALLSWFNRVGQYGVAVVEFQAKQPHGPNTEGKRKLDYVLTIVEPCRTEQDEKIARDFMQGLYAQRKATAGELPLDGEGAVVEDSRSGAISHVERDAEGNVNGVWDGDTDAERAKGEGSCSFPGCQLDDGHDGDHDVRPSIEDDAAAAADARTAQFTEQPGSDPAPATTPKRRGRKPKAE